MGTPDQDAYMVNVLGFDPAVFADPSADAAGGGGDAAGGAGSGTPAPAPAPQEGPPLNATTTEVYFARNSPALTPSDTAALDKVADDYAKAGGTGSIELSGYASIEGDANYNTGLATDRGNEVLKYLVGKGIPLNLVSATPIGPTVAFSTTDPRANRRVQIKVKPGASAPAPAPSAPPPQASDDELYKKGFDDGASGGMGSCPTNAGPTGEEAYERGYADGKRSKQVEPPGIRAPLPGEEIEKRMITVPSDDGVGTVQKEFTGSKSQLDQIEEIEQQRLNKQQFDNLSSIGETPTH